MVVHRGLNLLGASPVRKNLVDIMCFEHRIMYVEQKQTNVSAAGIEPGTFRRKANNVKRLWIQLPLEYQTLVRLTKLLDI